MFLFKMQGIRNVFFKQNSFKSFPSSNVITLCDSKKSIFLNSIPQTIWNYYFTHYFCQLCGLSYLYPLSRRWFQCYQFQSGKSLLLLTTSSLYLIIPSLLAVGLVQWKRLLEGMGGKPHGHLVPKIFAFQVSEVLDCMWLWLTAALSGF